MKKLDIVGVILLILMNWLQLAILYRYEYFTTVFTTDQLQKGFSNLFIYGNAIVFTLIIYPKLIDFMKRKQSISEIGAEEVFPFLNYHPEDVFNEELMKLHRIE